MLFIFLYELYALKRGVDESKAFVKAVAPPLGRVTKSRPWQWVVMCSCKTVGCAVRVG